MFGYIITSTENLPDQRQDRFREFYCGLCRTLRRRYGISGGLTLSYDMTFLGVLLNALYEPGEQTGEERCVAHPMKRHRYIESPVLEYCADLNIALAYHKCLDNWKDDKSIVSAAEARALESAYVRVSSARIPQCRAIEEWLKEIHRIEDGDIQAIDLPVNATGRMLGVLFQYRPGDPWAESLRIIGDGLGRFIYLMDAYDDLPGDLRRKRYNPLKVHRNRGDYEDFCRDAMMLAVADATHEFEMLPIVQDADILRNVLYSGIWTKYVMIRNKRDLKKKERGHAGSL